VSFRTFLAVVLTLAVTGALIVYAFWDVDLPELGRLLAGGNYRTLVPFLLLLTLFFALTALRWRIILRPVGSFTLRQVTPAMMIGFAGNNLLPAHLGEVVRAVVFGLRHGCSRTAVLATLVLERLLDVLAILLLYVAAAATLHGMPESVHTGFRATATVLGALALGVLLFLAAPARFRGTWERLSRPLPGFLGRLGDKALRAAEAGLGALRSPGAVLVLVGYSVAKWLMAAGMVWLSLWGYGLAVQPGLTFLVVAVGALAVTLPSVPGFFGVIQAAFVFALTPFGVSREVALASSVYYLLAQWIPVTAVGLVFFVTTGLDPKRVRREVERD
jgi:uncharacterized protein (TIRG00374 family)